MLKEFEPQVEDSSPQIEEPVPVPENTEEIIASTEEVVPEENKPETEIAESKYVQPQEEQREPIAVKDVFELPEEEDRPLSSDKAMKAEDLEGKKENESMESAPALELSSRVQLSGTGQQKMGKSMLTGGGSSPKLGKKRSPLKKRIDDRPG